MASSGSHLKYEPRTLEQREIDAKRNAPKYARERRLNAILTAKFLKAKQAFDNYYHYNMDAAFDADNGSWREAMDPWLRIKDTLFEFLQGYTKAAVDAKDTQLTGEALRNLAAAIIRVAKEDLAGAGRSNAFLDDSFRTSAMEYVETLRATYNLPQAQPDSSEEEEEA
ncbi:hypothetical protein B0I35DRAFT_414043 [Stachybotrys elegans]|uniref:Uncharacterized protein n=1 Tax=Stachybotrys elegans TaxID=80388 RepID=A0A8K0SIT5_9HYPO|nr:hypothetical protein B0I35DRAFT_414043 [Stachybotrys elegans]